MELGIYHEFPVLPGRSQAECFAAGFDIVDASEEYGLDVMWLAELHFDKRRALVAGDPVASGRKRCALLSRLTGAQQSAIWQWGFIERLVNGLRYIEVGPEANAAEFLAVVEAWAEAESV